MPEYNSYKQSNHCFNLLVLMPLYTLKNKQISETKRTQFAIEGIKEQTDLQAALRDNINIIAPDTLIIAEEFSGWAESGRRIDLLGIDKQSNLVVIELKRDETGSHMELQALRYAAMLSTMTLEKTIEVFQQYLDRRGIEKNAEETILDFLDWNDSPEPKFPTDIRVILASGNFSKELTTTVMWLNERDLDIRCVRLQPYKHREEILLNIEQIIPLPEAEEYRIQLREKAEAQKSAAKQKKNMPLITEARDRIKAKGFTKSPQLPTHRIIQRWIDEFGKDQNFQERINRHLDYWIAQREHPSLTHEELRAMLATQEQQPTKSV